MDYFVYNGIDSREFGMYIGRFGSTPLITHHAPPSSSTTEKITGWHGEMFFEQVYEARTIEIEYFILDVNDNIVKKIASWLKKIGVHEIFFNNEPYKVYYGTVEQSFDIESYSKQANFGKLKFICYNPFGYSSFTTQDLSNIEYNTGLMYNTGIPYVDSGIANYSFESSDLPNLDVYHGGNTNFALPKITITGSGDDITIGRYDDEARTDLIQECNYGSFSGELLIDSERRDCFLNSSLNNQTFEGDFFTLDGAGEIYYDVSGIIQSYTTTTIALSSNASSVDDIYNGKLMVINNNLMTIPKYSTIIDYDGTTKIATISSTENILNNSKYTIYDIQNGMNYFKITGTNLNITSIDFDFKFVFL